MNYVHLNYNIKILFIYLNYCKVVNIVKSNKFTNFTIFLIIFYSGFIKA